MSFWQPFWEIVLLASLIGFAGLVIVVGLGGIADIRTMLRNVEQRQSDRSNAEKAEEKG